MAEQLSFADLSWLQPSWQQLMTQRQQQRLHHALLLSGVNGMGKQLLANQLANWLLCQQSGQSQQPCGQCKSCQLFQAGSHPDLIQIAPNDKGLIPIDSVRSATDRAFRTSHQGGARVILLQQAEAMNSNAANALLKTLEEPPTDLFLLLTSDAPHLLLPTILSRSQTMTLQRPSDQEISEFLALRGVKAAKAFVSANRTGPLAILKSVTEGEQDTYKQVVRSFAASLVDGSVDAQLINLVEQSPEIAIGWCENMLHTLCRQPDKLQTDALRDLLLKLAPSDRISLLKQTSGQLLELRRQLLHPGVNRVLQIQAAFNRVIGLICDVRKTTID